MKFTGLINKELSEVQQMRVDADLSVEASKEQIQILGSELAKSKIDSIQKDSVINVLGQEVAKLKINLIQMKGGTD